MEQIKTTLIFFMAIKRISIREIILNKPIKS